MSDSKLKVSIVLGVKNGIRTIERFVSAVKNQTYKNIELVIVDNFSDDGTAEIAKKSADVFIQAGPERSAQRNIGIKNASGEYVLILDADQFISPTVIQECLDLIKKDEKLKMIFIPEDTVATGFWGKCKKYERDFYKIGDISAEAGRFFEKKVLIDLGGFDESQTGSEDWDLSDRVLKIYPKFARIKSSLIHDEGYIDLLDQINKKRYYSKNGISNYLSVAPAYRRRPFPLRPSVLKQWPKIIAHPILFTGAIVMKLLEGITIL